ncbi:MAG: DUF427 domain-containing protein [Gammaproteobacteria bacterium]|nr:MAG: DUF427 domain-containing protein [Gammaproteobacteria bacterium]
MKAVWHGTIIADSIETLTLEGNHYFPPDSLQRQYLTMSPTTTRCPWKGTASYLNIVVDDQVNADAAWYYPDPLPEASNIRNYVAFWKGVEIIP